MTLLTLLTQCRPKHLCAVSPMIPDAQRFVRLIDAVRGSDDAD
jgi:hypothetical protein